MSDNKITCEAINANKIKCAYAARYSVVDGRVLCGTHLKKEKLVADKVLLKPRVVKSKSSTKDNVNVCSENNKIVEIHVQTFDILNLPTEIICCIISMCDLKSQIIFSLSSTETKVMFPNLAECNKSIILKHIASQLTVEKLIEEASSFKVKLSNNGKLCKMITKNNSNYNVIKHVLWKNKSASNIASICGHSDIELVKQILNGFPSFTEDCLTSAVKVNNVELLVHLLNRPNHYTYYYSPSLREACKLGRLNCLVEFLQRGNSLSHSCISLLAINGHIDCLKYVHENNYAILLCGVITDAIKAGHLECMIYLVEILNIPTSDKTLCTDAARYGRLDCLMYLNEHKYIMTATVCSVASSKGNLECLKYAHENGCKLDKRSYKMALKNKHTLCEKYLFDNNCPRF